ncbi:hypothetical protein A3H80_00735 [Candidatus Roizmanbacteria bacterium RIFCSPLOWO2_02_FULL_37_19]|uniref:Uncharacterized protein n=1 Tax=Candidatus Roizmanbacteria bacterium RIFCSPHIGHO2_02_FULL_37_24 TaxID=1802037 RepID=A0A1F7GUV2_9BACT|nr:MAG: hypothetical protein A2862_00420 [Candidatus Roizmanbacteria bacterium RIFCSPHIGHO2_01_FULL_38_41]OGK22663.1 MAG: hypothetical protein A3C24_00540 [Candidatus Roizmanbacteria bacterium RIFCSPHIGHO2_02_FULL_37_24]OGK32513.1 MAG: hypothetical protein A3E10_00605 [Candidatus Roizmanbacteria bacterium RIFCSPHIGHO2_12_FULL_37_23]OGK45127.1 MAG: hypothetical protein A2956_03005 [Candidatus Roizmanbacteria bacterium RIFCSPLOWO2_01_FULL_37_57]OGK54493.1 MAG: hypothetical protein A3H80_00735 [Ca
MDIRKIKSFQQIEEFIEVYYRLLPSLPLNIRKSIATYLPPLAALVGIYHIIVALLPPPYSILESYTFFSINSIMLRGVLIVLGLALITSYKNLAQLSLKGWYNLYYIAFFHFFLSLIFFNLTYFISPLIVWYVLFQAKRFYR